MLPFLGEVYGNPSSVHRVGRRARALLDEARDKTANVLSCKPSEVVFTSGGTESNNLAIFGAARFLKSKGRHLVTSAIEHHAVLHCFEHLAKKEGFELTVLPVDSEGRVSVESLARALRPDTVLVSIMAANNEIGTLQPVSELGALCRERGVVFHTDAAQWFGKQPFENIQQFNADLVSACAHKFHGPKGVGALFVRSPLHLQPVLFGGSHENEHRAGTENLAAIVGFTEALARFVRAPVFDKRYLRPLTAQLRHSLEHIPGVQIVGSTQHGLANTVSFVTDSTDSIALLASLDMEGICASSGSACSAGSLEPSHVVLALGVQRSLANSLIRFSLGRASNPEECRYASGVLADVIHRVQHSKNAKGSIVYGMLSV